MRHHHSKKPPAPAIQPGRIFLPTGKPTCKQCFGLIAFKQLASGKWCPVETDGTDHWDKCRERQEKLGLRANQPKTLNMGTTIGRNYRPVESDEPPF